MRILLTLAFSLCSSAAFAQCANPDDTFLSCSFSSGKKSVDVCIEGENVTYAFGRKGARPELTLSAPMGEIEYIPWPGVGSSIFEEVVFSNRNIRYVVVGGVTRIFPKEDGGEVIAETWGVIDVIEGVETLATLDCDKGSAIFNYTNTISQAKAAAGLCWVSYDQNWQACN